MGRKMKMCKAAECDIKPAWVRRFGRRICTCALAVSAVAVLLAGGQIKAFASEQIQVSSDEGQVTVRHDDLNDTLQKGGLGVVTTKSDGTASLASTYDSAVLEERIVSGIKAWETSIDVSGLGLTSEDITNGAVRSIVNSHPEFIGISGGYTYWTAGNSVTAIDFTYLDNAKEDQQTLDAAIKDLESRIDISKMTDEEIVLAYHEYLTSTVSYAYDAYLANSLGSNHEYDMYGALVSHSAVCQGYSETMFYLLKKAGLSCAIASSSNINHAWNIVKLHGKWYHIDATWDDPVWDMPGRSYHNYFLVSFDTMNALTDPKGTGVDRTDMILSAQWGDTYTTATDTSYENGRFWNGINKAMFYKNGYWYSISEGSSKTAFNINKYQYSTNTNRVLYSGTAKWTTPDGRYYVGVYSSIYLQDNNLYFTTPDSLNRIDLTASAANPVELVNIRTKYNSATGNNLYAFGMQYGKLVYFIADTPNVTKTKDSSDSTKYTKNYEEYTFDLCINHEWDSGVVIKKPTYTETGIKLYTCKNCGTTKTGTIEKLICTSHVWDDGVVITEPTYRAEGAKLYTCKNCDTTKTEAIARLPLQKITVKAVTSASGVKLTWNRESHADGYYVYRKNGSLSYKLIKAIGNADTLAYIDSSAVSGTTYTYMVRAYVGQEKGDGTETSLCFIGRAAAKTSNSASGVKVTWNKVGGVSGYIVYRRTTTGSWGRIKVVRAGVLAYIDTQAVSGVRYLYAVKPYRGKVTGTFATSTITRLKSPVVKAASAGSGIKLTWTKAAGAAKYKVYRKTASGNWTVIKTVTGSVRTITDRTARKGVTYYYTVKSVNGTSVSAAAVSCKFKR